MGLPGEGAGVVSGEDRKGELMWMGQEENKEKLTLRHFPLFRDLSEEELEKLSEFAIRRTYPKKTVIFHEGSEKEAVYFIQEGLVKTFKTDENGHENIVSFLKRGDLFPHTGLFNDHPYPATAEAIEAAVLLALPVTPFEQFIVGSPLVSIKMMRVMSEKMTELQGKLQELTGQDVQNRGQAFLVKLAEEYGKPHKGEMRIEFPMAHQDFANAIGTSRETVSRLLNQLRKEGILEISRMGFIVHDLEALKHWREK